MTHPPNPSQNRDFKDLDNGLQYKDAKVGAGRAASEGDRVVFDWEGYTIGKKREAVFVGAQAGAGMVGSRATGSVQKGSRDITWWLLFAQISDDERALRPLSPLADACTTRSLPYRDLSALEPAQTGAFPPVGSSVRSMQETPASTYLHARVRAIRKTFCCRVSVRVAGACLCLVGRLPRWSTILEAAAMSPSLLSRS